MDWNRVIAVEVWEVSTFWKCILKEESVGLSDVNVWYEREVS